MDASETPSPILTASKAALITSGAMVVGVGDGGRGIESQKLKADKALARAQATLVRAERRVADLEQELAGRRALQAIREKRGGYSSDAINAATEALLRESGGTLQIPVSDERFARSVDTVKFNGLIVGLLRRCGIKTVGDLCQWNFNTFWELAYTHNHKEFARLARSMKVGLLRLGLVFDMELVEDRYCYPATRKNFTPHIMISRDDGRLTIDFAWVFGGDYNAKLRASLLGQGITTIEQLCQKRPDDLNGTWCDSMYYIGDRWSIDVIREALFSYELCFGMTVVSKPSQ